MTTDSETPLLLHKGTSGKTGQNRQPPTEPTEPRPPTSGTKSRNRSTGEGWPEGRWPAAAASTGSATAGGRR